MATYNLTPEGYDIVDDKFKSRINALRGGTLDLVGCGNKDYATIGGSANYNYRLGCNPIRSLAGHSYKSTWYQPGPDETVISTLRPVAHITWLLSYMNSITPSVDAGYGGTGYDLTTTPSTSIGTAGTWVQLGSTWTRVDTGDNVTGLNANTLTLTIPQVKLIKECGRTIGYKMSAAINQVGFDPNTCTPVQLGSTRVSFYKVLRDKITGTNLTYFTDGQSFTSIFGPSRSTPLELLPSFAPAKNAVPKAAAEFLSVTGRQGLVYSVAGFS